MLNLLLEPIDAFFAPNGPLRFLDYITPTHLVLFILFAIFALGVWINFG